MKILKMKLENFQGVKELKIDPQGESSAIYGDNGTGKSTVYNAFTWLMYGKPSTTEKNYTPKTTGSHNLHHSVEMTVELADGSEMVLKKDYHEVYKTIKGNPQPVLSGHTTDYSMDGVPVSETQFKKNLLEIYHDEELAKMLTSYNYFLESMKVADRRKILLQVCGDADFNEVIESQGDLLRELPEMLRKPGKVENYYTVDEYRAIAAKEKNLTDKELADIPQRIDEAEKAKPDVTGLDAQIIDNTMAEIKEKRRELESQRAARESGATTTIRQQIAELESQRAAREAKHVRAESEANKGTYERISNLRYMASTIDTDIMHAEQDKREHENEIKRLNRRREQLLAEWNEENEKEWTGSEICPTCGQQFPAEQIEEAKENFNTAKAQNLETINKRGMTECSSGMIKKEQDEIEALDARLVELKEKKAETAQNLATAEKAVLATTDYKDTAEYRQFTEQIESLQEKLKDARAAAAEADNVLSGQLKELDESLEAEQSKKAQLAMVKKQDERIAQLEKKEEELAAKYEQLQKGIYLCEQFVKAKTKLLDEKINSRFKTLRFRLFIEQQNGGIADDCEALVPCKTGLVPFKSANNAARINAEECVLVGSINCLPDTAFEQMEETKNIFHKTGKRQGYHVIISFSPEEKVTSEQAMYVLEHFAKDVLGDDYEAVYAVHTDREHMHGHLIWNSVSMTTGKKYNSPKSNWKNHLQPITNKYCDELGLSIMPAEYSRNPKNISRDKWEKEMSMKEIILRDAKMCAYAAGNVEHFKYLMKRLGYVFKKDAWMEVQAPGFRYYHKLAKLDEMFSEDMLRHYVDMP
ncbi:relaxase/mobilization nuclease domain-containing protein [Fusicatenibacter saccharivorans]|uniref:relaxase/mobilization nuclease domain-containing protein n=1 Tax=Fusicatenibacter saccharivorans TaxID=1150298 RepID=UPI001D07D552|nr:relaxase/mobilization nuclease domain-containing protein [Fusicatenibacter saccharivorans]MCB7100529.1 relaxase/mobilization nuclease domain-containing protein [Fusicatenibacter saccharivorans]